MKPSIHSGELCARTAASRTRTRATEETKSLRDFQSTWQRALKSPVAGQMYGELLIYAAQADQSARADVISTAAQVRR